MRTYFKVLVLDGATLDAVKADAAGLFTALEIFLAVGLILAVGQLTAISGIRQGRSVYQGLFDAAARLEAAANRRLVPSTIAEPLTELSQSFTALGNVLEAGQPPLGKQASQIISVIGGWLSSPFYSLATWMAALAFLFICARILGGQGSLREHMSLALLAFAPQVLTILGSFDLVPALATFAAFFGFCALVWSLAISVVALRHAHVFSTGRAVGTIVLAVLLAAALSAIVAFFWGAVLAGFIAWLI